MALRKGDWLMLTVALLLALIFGVGRIVLRLNHASDGLHVFYNIPDPYSAEHGVRTTAIARVPRLIAPGDRLLAINDIPLAEGLRRALRGENLLDLRPGVQQRYTVRTASGIQQLDVWVQPWLMERVFDDLRNHIVAAGYLLLGLWVFVRRAQLPAARALLVLGVSTFCHAIYRVYDLELTDFFQAALFWPVMLMLTFLSPLISASLVHFSLSFPSELPRARSISALLYGAMLVYSLISLVVQLQAPDPLEHFFYKWDVGYAMSTTLMCIALLLCVAQFRRVQSRSERQQWLVVLIGALVSAAGTILLVRLPLLFTGFMVDGWNALISASELAFPASLALAVSQYRLFGINSRFNHALVYTALGVGIIALYAVVVVGFGNLLGSNSPWLAMAATAAVAVLFEPMRRRLLRFVNRTLHGKSEDPTDALRRLSRDLSTMQDVPAALTAIARAAAAAVNVPAARIEVGGITRHHGDPVLPGHALELPLRHHEQEIGRLWLAARAEGTPVHIREVLPLLPELGLATSNIKLTLDLQRARLRMRDSLEEERRRIRRDLHDSLGPALASVANTLDAAEAALEGNDGAEGALALVTEARAMSAQTLGEVRRVVYGLRPPALDDLGLNGALQQLVERANLQPGGPNVICELPDDLTGCSASVEVAAYRIASEALTNVLRHSQAANASIRVWRDAGAMHIEVIDNGTGIHDSASAGVGLRAMTERAHELGGSLEIQPIAPRGTCVLARLPEEPAS